jgi:hypothetical protein
MKFSSEEAMVMVQGQVEHPVEMVPHLEERLMEYLNKEAMADLVCLLHTHVVWCSSIWSQVQNDVFSARSDDTKSLKGVGLDWISSRDISLNPSIIHNIVGCDRTMLASMTVRVRLWSH